MRSRVKSLTPASRASRCHLAAWTGSALDHHAIGIEAGEPVLGDRVALLGGEAEQLRRALLVDGDALALEQHHAIFDLGFGDAGLGGLARPFRGLRLVHRDAAAELIEAAKIVLRPAAVPAAAAFCIHSAAFASSAGRPLPSR